MGDIKDLQNTEAIEKMKEIAENTVGHFCTFVEGASIVSRPMHTQEVDGNGNFWFFSSKDSNKNQQIQQNSKVQLLYAIDGKSEYLSIEGTATISTDQAKIDELWSGFVKTWFTEGKHDPKLSLIEVTPTAGYYWDTKNSKMVSLIKIAAGSIIGKTMDDGIEGSLNI
ncbi:MAG: pyridoxamine 5'-phosphate oxidase family protein [Chitinophagaceae bacterium]